MSTPRTSTPLEAAPSVDDPGLGQILDTRDSLGGIRFVFAGSVHDGHLPESSISPAVFIGPTEADPSTNPGKDATVSHFGWIDESKNPDLDDIELNYLHCGHEFWVAEDDERIVGTAGLLIEPPANARVVRMSVEQTVRRRGIARLLMQQLIQSARDHGLEAVWAYTEPHWLDAVGFYISQGFVQVGQDEVDVHLRLKLD
jgi:GNAT superfamily N-acetyltransferase